MKANETVKKETVFLASVTAILTVMMLAVFLILKKFDLSVLLGAVIGAAVSVVNFFLMALTLQKSLDNTDEKDRNAFLKMSRTYRMLGIVVIILVALFALGTNVYSTLIPLLFPRISVIFRQMTLKKEESKPSDDETEK